VFFFLLINIRVVGGEINMYDCPGCTINDWDKVLREKAMRSVLPEIVGVAYQGVSIKVLVFRIPSETQSLLDSAGQWEPLVIANGPAICINLVGFDAYGILNSMGRFTEVGPPLTDFLGQPLNLGVGFYNIFTVQKFLR